MQNAYAAIQGVVACKLAKFSYSPWPGTTLERKNMADHFWFCYQANTADTLELVKSYVYLLCRWLPPWDHWYSGNRQPIYNDVEADATRFLGGTHGTYYRKQGCLPAIRR